MEVLDSRAVSGNKPEASEVHGKVEGFVPAGDYVLIRRMEAITEEGSIIRPEAYVELAERGEVIAVSGRAYEVPVGVTAKFSKYGAEEIHFDDEGQFRYVLVRLGDIRGWHYTDAQLAQIALEREQWAIQGQAHKNMAQVKGSAFNASN